MPDSRTAPKAPQSRIVETADLIMDAITARHGNELSSDPRLLRESLFAELRRRMALRAGRRRSQELDHAEELRRQGKSFHEIASILRPEYRNSGTYQRQEIRDRLKKGLRKREKRRVNLSPATNPHDFVSPVAD